MFSAFQPLKRIAECCAISLYSVVQVSPSSRGMGRFPRLNEECRFLETFRIWLRMRSLVPGCVSSDSNTLSDTPKPRLKLVLGLAGWLLPPIAASTSLSKSTPGLKMQVRCVPASEPLAYAKVISGSCCWPKFRSPAYSRIQQFCLVIGS